MDICCEFGTLLSRQMSEPDVDRRPYLGKISPLPLPNEMLDRELSPKVEVNVWPGSAPT
jgi:hypothetical protein